MNLMCLCSQNTERRGALPDMDAIAYKLRMTKSRAESLLGSLVDAGLFEWKDGICYSHNWDRRQFQSGGERQMGKAAPGRYVYIVGSKQSTLVKIGFSRNPWARINELQTGSTEHLEILATFRSKSTSEVDLHLLLAAFQYRGEWFDLPASIRDVIDSAAAEHATYENLVELLRSTATKKTVAATTAITTIQNRTDTEQNRTEQTPKVPANGVEYPPEFLVFWEAYPKKEAKGDALKAWKKLHPSQTLQQIIIAAIVRQKESPQWKKERGTFIPHPATWLNRAGWDDETPPPLVRAQHSGVVL